MKKPFQKTRVLFFLLLFATGTLYSAQDLSNARSMAMGGAYSCLALGAEAPLYNPANLSLRTKYPLTVTLLGAGFGLSNNSFNLSLYNRYNGNFLTDASKTDILNRIPKDGLSVYSVADAHVLGIGYGQLAFTARLKVGLNGSIGREMIDLLLNGNQLNKVYSFKPFSGDEIALGEYAVSFGQKFDLGMKNISHFGVGISVKYLKGYSYAGTLESHAQSLTDYTSAEASGRLLANQATGGSGYGIDIGSTMTFLYRWRASLSVENVLSNLRWNTGTESHTFDFELKATNADELFNGHVETDSILVSSDSSFAIPAFNTRLPAILRLGILRAVGRFLIAFEWEQGFENSAFAGKKALFAIGTEYRLLRFFHLRAGTSLGGKFGWANSLGFGFVFGTIRWDFAARSFNGFFTPSARGIGLGTSLIFRY
ncbi:MAG: hypothetical protein GWP06_17255 [Actinobacteria bacterium]|nr:hypothetical protein [Actinomycetota bacterium]